MSASSADLSIVHPWDPYSQSIGGFDTFLDGFLRYAPPEWTIELVGVSGDPASRPVGRWQTLDYRSRPIRFFPVLAQHAPAFARRVPLSVRFALAARRRRPRLSGRIVVYHRFESVFAVRHDATRQSCVVYLHNHPGEVRSPHSDVHWSRMPGLYERLLCSKLRRSDLVIGVDPRTPDWVRRTLPDWKGRALGQQQWADPKVFHATRGVVRQAARDALRARLGLPEDTRLLIFAGRFERQKDLPLLIDAFARAAAEIEDLGLILVGDGRLRPLLQGETEKRGLGSRIRIHSPVTRKALAVIYRGCDVAVCTSGFEAGPRHAFESAACGLPVVSFDVGQVKSLIGDDPMLGSIVGDRSAAAFARAVIAVMARPTDEARSMRCATNAARFSPEVALRPILEAYRSLLEQPKAGGRGS